MDNEEEQKRRRHERAVEAGKRRKEQLGSEGYRNMGKRGGEATKQKGKEYFSEIGKLGGRAVYEKYGAERMSELGKAGRAVATGDTPPPVYAQAEWVCFTCARRLGSVTVDISTPTKLTPPPCPEHSGTVGLQLAGDNGPRYIWQEEWRRDAGA